MQSGNMPLTGLQALAAKAFARRTARVTIDPQVAAASLAPLPARSFRIYDQEAFRHFLALERRRAERSGRSLLLLRVSLKPHRGKSVRLSPTTADTVFSTLSLSVRDVDYVGWHRDGYVASAVLTQGARIPDPGVVRDISQRVVSVLNRDLPPDVADCVRVRVRLLRLGPRC